MNREVFPALRQQALIRKNIETALSTAALQFALTGVGVAWVPYSLAKIELTDGRLRDLSDRLPAVKLSIMAVRLNGSKSPAENRFWEVITETRQSSA